MELGQIHSWLHLKFFDSNIGQANNPLYYKISNIR